MSNIYRQMSPHDFKKAWLGQDSIQNPYRFLVHEFFIEEMGGCFQISIRQCVNGSLAAIDRRIAIEPTCLVPIEEQRRYAVERGVRELQKYQAHKENWTLRLEDMVTIENLPAFDCRLGSCYEIWV